LSRTRWTTETEGPKVPAYIVTFSDMVTLLLTFFVMLLTLARVQDPELYHIGRDSFIKSMQHLGLGALSGKKVTPDFGEVKVKYFITNPDRQFEGRTIDSKEENIRRLFKKVTQSMKSTPSQIIAKKANFSVTSINFSQGEALLNEPAKKFLTQFAVDLQQDAGSQEVKLYVLGLARDERTKKGSGYCQRCVPRQLRIS